MIFNLLVLLTDNLLSGSILNKAAMIEPEEVGALIRSVIVAGIWSMYMLKSVRVRQTFQNRRRTKFRPCPAAALPQAEPEVSLCL